MLEIDCHYDADRPNWMDSGEREKHITQQIKAQVEQNGKTRRGIALKEKIVEDLSNTPKNEQILPTPKPNSSSIRPIQLRESKEPQEAKPSDLAYREGISGFKSDSDSPERFPALREQSARLDTSPKPTAKPLCQDLGLGSETPRSENDMAFIIGYLDYVLPSLFPFYTPSIIDGGRSRVLVLATKNNGFFRGIVALSAYFFSIVPVSSDPTHKVCAESIWKELHTQVTSALSTIHRDLIAVDGRGVGGSLLDSVYLMANIVQYLSFEIAIRSGKWKVHLTAAINLFEQILQVHGWANGSKSIRIVLSKLLNTNPGPRPDKSNADQGIFNFFSSILLVNDMIPSTSLGQPPKLKAYYSELEGGDRPPVLRTEDILGCESWILLIVADIATLHAWKKEVSKTGVLKTTNILSHATSIENRIQDGLKRLDELDASRGKDSVPNLKTYLQYPTFPYDLGSSIRQAMDDMTSIWSYAAHTYLLVVTQGWDLSDTPIRTNTRKSMQLFQKIFSPCWLRCLVWPICISGCVAVNDDERQAFRRIGSSMQALQAFGTVDEALTIMETVLSNDKIGTKSWDI
ncbi:fungal-specific transcription factor domain-containing protein [Mariannaea sp. PMI_226]|nr:fungal-specific transcription factor domain-containing protein [Mariannaea sp. PMI_226]